jgi:hypothetical protein
MLRCLGQALNQGRTVAASRVRGSHHCHGVACQQQARASPCNKQHMRCLRYAAPH